MNNDPFQPVNPPVEPSPQVIQPAGQDNSQFPPETRLVSPPEAAVGYQPGQGNAPEDMSSYEYLDSIATEPTKSFHLNPKRLLLIGGGLLATITTIAIIAVVQGATPDTTALKFTLLAQAEALTEVTQESQPNIKTRDLVPINSGLSAQLATTKTDLQKVFSASGLKAKKIPKDIAAKESNAKLLKKLDDARLEGVFDRVYTREVSFQLERLLVDLRRLDKIVSDKETKAQIKNSLDNLGPLQEELAKFNK